VSAAGQQIPLKGSGTIEPRTGRGSLSLNMSSVQEGLTLDEIFDGTRVYIRSSLFDNALPHGKHWITLDLKRLLRSTGLGSLSDLAGQNPGESLQQLRAVSGKVEKAGSERVAGVRTTHYRATIDLDHVADKAPAKARASLRRSIKRVIQITGQKKLPTQVWIDGQGRARRMTYEQRFAIGGQRLNSSVSIDIYDFGTKVGIEPPPASQVTDLTKLAAQGQGG
jgi:hypothetical protein